MRSQNRPDCFLVYRSASHTYLRLFLLGFPWLCVVLAGYTGFFPFYAVAACMFAVCYPFLIVMCTVLRQHRTIQQEPVARDFPSAESLENRGILGVFPVFQTARMGKKTRHRPQTQLCGVAFKLDSLGVHLLRPVRPIHIAWEDVRFTGCLTMRKPLPGIMHECINRTRMAATIRVPFYLHYGSIDKLSGGVYSHSPSIPLTYTGSNRCTFSSLNP